VGFGVSVLSPGCCWVRGKKNNNQHHLTLQIKLGANKSWQVPSALPAKLLAVFSTCCCPLLCGCLVCLPAFPPFRLWLDSIPSQPPKRKPTPLLDCLRGNSPIDWQCSLFMGQKCLIKCQAAGARSENTAYT